MNKKNIIQIVVICACFAASGIVIYNNFFKKAALPPALVGNGTVAALKSDAAILPNGAAFDLAPVKNSHLRFNLIDYPKVDFQGEVGIDQQQILKPLHSLQNPGIIGNPIKK